MTDTAFVDASSSDVGELLSQIANQDLDPITPTEGIDLYLDSRKRDLKSSSLDTHRSALNFFARWCEDKGIDTLDQLNGRLLHEFRIWRREDATEKVDSLSKKSEKTQQDVIRAFIRFCESIDAVEPRLHEKVQSPSLNRGEAVRDAMVDPDTARQISRWLATFDYASLIHVIWTLLSETGARIGAIRALDIQDCNLDDEMPYIEFRHRPDTDTGLKNGPKSERLVSISDQTCNVIRDFIDERRADTVDSYGRDPLLTTSNGRITTSTIRKYIYMVTRPCSYSDVCPHGRSEDQCEATSNDLASKCPSSRSPHAIRRGYITHELTAGVDRSYVSGRCDVSEEVIKEHYDARDERERMEVRARMFDEAHRSASQYGDHR